MAVTGLDIDKVACSIGAVNVTGVTRDGEAISVDYGDVELEKVIGANGNAVFIRKHKGDTAQLTIMLMGNNKNNAELNAYLQESRDAGIKTWPLIIKDLLGVDQITAAQCSPVGNPKWSRGSDHTPMEWVFELAGVVTALGAGNVV
jgi:hypothetical protein